MAQLTPVALSRVGIPDIAAQAVAVALGGGSIDSVRNSGREFCIVFNNSGNPINVTVPYTLPSDGVLPTAHVTTIPAGKIGLIGPFITQYYNDANGNFNITYSATTNISVFCGQLFQNA
jgi:hypothetical protein